MQNSTIDPSLRLHPRWSSLCNGCKWKAQKREAGERCGEHVSVPIMEVLLLPSGHRWPSDPGPGLNVKGCLPGSAWTTASPWPGMCRHGNALRTIGGEMGRCFASGKGWIRAFRKTPGWTSCVCFLALFFFYPRGRDCTPDWFSMNLQLEGNIQTPPTVTKHVHCSKMVICFICKADDLTSAV